MYLVVTEYPKSGGNWLCSLLGSALGRSKRDVYDVVFRTAHVERHPWYADGALDFPHGAVIKSHEYPGSALVPGPATFIHLVRDGRDVVVSKWFFESEFMVRNGYSDSFDTDFDEYVPAVARAWADYVEAWRAAPGAIEVRYEDLLQDGPKALGALLRRLGLERSRGELQAAVDANTMDRLRKSFDRTFAHNSFFRKGVAGDWRNHFSERNLGDFRSVCDGTLQAFGYS